MEPCPDLLPLEEKGTDQWVVMLQLEDTTYKYYECAIKHDKLSDIVKIERGITDEED